MNEAEFTRLYMLYKNDVYRFAYSRIEDHSDAEDISQDVFFKLFLREAAFGNDTEAKAWLFTVTANRVRDVKDSYWYRFSELMSDEIFYGIQTQTVTDSETALYDIINSLPPLTAGIIYSHYLYGFSLAESAKIAGCSHSAAVKRLSRGRKRLKQLLTREK